MKKKFLKTISELVAIRSISENPKELKKSIEYVMQFFQDTGAHVKFYQQSGKYSLVVSTKKTKNFDVLFAAHLDVVNAPENMFRVAVRGGRLYGRGVCDMKGEAAVLMHVMRDVMDSRKNLNLGFIFTTDEEIGGQNGMGYLINTLGYRARVAIIPDGANNLQEIVHQNKGVLHITIAATGKAAHASRPWLGVNAIDQIIEAYNRIKKAFPRNMRVNAWQDTYSVGKIIGGSSVNQVPKEATLHLDIRHIPTTNSKALLKKIQQLARPCKVQINSQGDGIYVDEKHESIRLYGDIVKRYTGQKFGVVTSHGSNDGRYLTALNIPIIVSRPLSDGQHSDNEWISINDLELFYNINKQFVMEFAS